MTQGADAVGGRYVIGDLLGSGGMAEVHRAHDTRLDRQVAVKRLTAALAADPVAQARFRREAQAAASLNHPTIAAVFDTGDDVDLATGRSIPYIVMELVEGPTLREVLSQHGQLASDRALELVGEVLAALAVSHAAGIVHRDIKPANVMLTATGQVKVMDFGIARAVDDSSTSLTETAGVVGTAHYFSPEQARGETVDHRSDLYAVGCLLYALLIGAPPFVGESSLSVAYQHVREPADAPSSHRPELGPGVDAVVAHALAKDPRARYQSAQEMRADVDRLRAGQAPQASTAAELTTQLAAAPVEPPDIGPAGPDGATVAAPVPVVVAPPRSEPRPTRRRFPAGPVLVAALLVLLAVGGLGLYQTLLSTDDTSTTVSVPAVLGSGRPEAERTLRAAGLTVRVVARRGRDDDTVDTVTRQLPTSGATVPPGTEVVLTVNTGPETTERSRPSATATGPSDEPDDETSDEPDDETSDEPDDDSSDEPSREASGESSTRSPSASSTRSSSSASATSEPTKSPSASAGSSTPSPSDSRDPSPSSTPSASSSPNSADSSSTAADSPAVSE